MELQWTIFMQIFLLMGAKNEISLGEAQFPSFLSAFGFQNQPNQNHNHKPRIDRQQHVSNPGLDSAFSVPGGGQPPPPPPAPPIVPQTTNNYVNSGGIITAATPVPQHSNNNFLPPKLTEFAAPQLQNSFSSSPQVSLSLSEVKRVFSASKDMGTQAV